MPRKNTPSATTIDTGQLFISTSSPRCPKCTWFVEAFYDFDTASNIVKPAKGSIKARRSNGGPLSLEVRLKSRRNAKGHLFIPAEEAPSLEREYPGSTPGTWFIVICGEIVEGKTHDCVIKSNPGQPLHQLVKIV